MFGHLEVPMAVWLRKPFTCHMTPCHCFFLGLYAVEDDSTMFLRNVSDYVVTRSHIAEESPRKGFGVL